jgi:recombination protein RecT
MECPRHNFSANKHGTTGADFFGANGRRDRGEMVGVYAYAKLTTGAYSRPAILDRDDVMAAKAASDGSDSEYSPWNRLDAGKDHPELRGRSMWWKTAARRLEPWVPTSAQYRLELARAAAEAYRGVQPASAPETPAPVPPVNVFDGEIAEPQPITDDWPATAPIPGGDSDA